MESIVLEKGFEMSFPAGVEEEAEEIEKNEKIITPEEIAKRRDIRQTMTFTIKVVIAHPGSGGEGITLMTPYATPPISLTLSPM